MKEDKSSSVPSIPALAQSENRSPDAWTKENLEESETKETEFLREQVSFLDAKTKNMAIRNRILESYADSLGPDRKLREKYSFWIFIGVCFYMLLVLALTFCGKIPAEVRIALVGSTSINVIGLLAIVLKFTFSSHHHKILE